MEADVLRGLENFETNYNGPLSVFANEYLKNKINHLNNMYDNHPKGIALLNYLSNSGGASATEPDIPNIKENVGSISKKEIAYLEEIKAIYRLGGRTWLTLTGDIIAEFLKMVNPAYENKINDDARSWGTP